MSDRWRDSLIPANATIQEAIQCLERSGLKFAMVVDETDRLLGTISDGDIRRGLLRGITLADPANSVMTREPFVAPPGTKPDAIRHLMRANQIMQMPIVDGDRRVVGLFVLEEMLGALDRSNLMVVMAGGKGTRLGRHTQACPKPLLPIGSKPMIDHIIERARDSGIGRFVVTIQHLGNMIEEHLGDGSKFGVAIDYAREQTPLGTGGALSLIEPKPSEPFLVTNGDVLTDLRYGEILDYHLQHRAVATMAVRSFEWQHPFGVVHTRGVDITGFEEKPVFLSHVNAGIYVLDPIALEYLDFDKYCDMPMLFERLQAASHRVIVYPMHEHWLDIGSPEDLERARRIHLSDPGDAN